MKSFKNYLAEILLKAEPETKKYLKHTGIGSVDDKNIDSIHSHSDIKTNFDDNQHKIIAKHTKNSKNTNAYLHELQTNSLKKSNKDIEKDIKNVSSLFTPENVNRKPIITYSGIPHRLGMNFLNMPAKTKHTITRFTSTSTSLPVAKQFARHRSEKYEENDLHILKCYNKPGSGISVATQSSIGKENEFLLHHGAHITYIGSNVENKDSLRPVYTHHVIVHSTHTPIEQYGKIKNKSIIS